MPFVQFFDYWPSCRIAIWHDIETLNHLESITTLYPEEWDDYQLTPPARKSQFLIARQLLLHLFNGLRPELSKDEYGKPVLQSDHRFVSISHTGAYIALSLSDQNHGIDLQQEVVKIKRIAKKFLHPDELQSVSPSLWLRDLHIYWGAKEAMYKAYGKKKLTFSTHIRLSLDSPVDCQGMSKGIVSKEQFFQEYKVNWHYIHPNLALVYAYPYT